MKVIIAGGRDFNDYDLLKRNCDAALKNNQIIEVVSGTCRGADLLGERYAREKGYPIKQFPADWNLGKKAGFIRNKQMADYADALIAFWDGKSPGTRNMIHLAHQNNLMVAIIQY